MGPFPGDLPGPSGYVFVGHVVGQPVRLGPDAADGGQSQAVEVEYFALIRKTADAVPIFQRPEERKGIVIAECGENRTDREEGLHCSRETWSGSPQSPQQSSRSGRSVAAGLFRDGEVAVKVADHQDSHGLSWC